MQHQIDSQRWGPSGSGMVEAVEGCVHCGFCLPACPTYRELGEEMDSPRGRILLMKEALEGNVPFSEVEPYIDRCLGCLACEPACPSGVQYHRLLHPFREHSHKAGAGTAVGRLRREALHRVLSSARLFRLSLHGARLAARLAPVLPSAFRHLLEFSRELPWPLPVALPLPAQVSAVGPRRGRVALLTGCAQSVLAPEISAAAARVLAANGVEVVIPPSQGCCGSLALHDGLLERARALARRTIESFSLDVDAVISTTAGCGSGMLEYPDLLADCVEAEAAEGLAAKVQDIHVYLQDLGLVTPPSLTEELVVVYQDACHLKHARGIEAQPRSLLQAVGNLHLVEIGDGGACCGSAGTYNLEQPEMASRLGEQKARRIAATGAEIVASGNIGCLVQIRRHLASIGSSLPVVHTVELLDRAYSGED